MQYRRVTDTDAMLGRVLAMGLCLSMYVSVTRRYCIKTAAHIKMILAYDYRFSSTSYTDGVYPKIREQELLHGTLSQIPDL